MKKSGEKVPAKKDRTDTAEKWTAGRVCGKISLRTGNPDRNAGMRSE